MPISDRSTLTQRSNRRKPRVRWRVEVRGEYQKAIGVVWCKRGRYWKEWHRTVYVPGYHADCWGTYTAWRNARAAMRVGKAMEAAR